MSKLDHLLQLVDSIDLKSDLLLHSFHQSSHFSQSISSNNNSISDSDIRIENIHSYIDRNYHYTSDLHDFSTKLYLFEHELNQNDAMTNENIYANLVSDLGYLSNKYKHHYQAPVPTKETPVPTTKASDASLRKHLPKSVSISNMSLKPIRCKSNKVYRKKSNYKISNIFNYPILDSPVEVQQRQTSGSSFSSLDNIMDESYTPSNDTTPEIEQDLYPDLETNPFKFDAVEEYDNESSLSDSLDLEFENFDSFLRKSRINLNQDSYPYVVRKSASEASINPETPPISKPSFKFHNPIDNLKLSTLSPTVEAIYSIPEVDLDNPKTKLESLLTKYIENSGKSAETPFESPFSFFNNLMSPSKPPQTTGRRNSLIGRSLTESFLMLMQNEAPIPRAPPVSNVGISHSTDNPKRRKRNKLEELKSVPKTQPITIENEIHSKRLPPLFKTNSGASSLILDSNKSFIVNHGQMSIFKHPIISPISHRSLQDALNSSI